MREALFYEKLDGAKVVCKLCPHNCVINDNSTGICGVRKNTDGILYSLVYKKAITVNIDPIEKKPLYHFLPDSKTLSIGTIGCNLKCMHCQNHEISQIKESSMFSHLEDINYRQIIDMAIKNKCKSISFTYNEPTISIETIIELSKIAKESGLRIVLVTNGYINQQPLKVLLKYIDAVNIDLKSFNDDFYKKICGASLNPILETIKTCIADNIHTEITTLILEGKNDNIEEIENIINFVSELNNNIPLHFSKSYPLYKMKDIFPTKEEYLLEIKEIAKNKLNHVYLGNIIYRNEIVCPSCKSKKIKTGTCKNCKEKIYGKFE